MTQHDRDDDPKDAPDPPAPKVTSLDDIRRQRKAIKDAFPRVQGRPKRIGLVVPQGPQPWDTEPSSADWADPATGYECAIRRTPEILALCGYVGVGQDHPWYGKTSTDRVEVPRFWFDRKLDDNSVGILDIFAEAVSGEALGPENVPVSLGLHVHKGVTWSGPFPDGSKDDALWWFGFDTAHAGDLMPGLWKMRQPGGLLYDIRPPGLGDLFPEVYRDFDYVKAQVEKLANQLRIIEEWVHPERARDRGPGEGGPNVTSFNPKGGNA